jgi:muramoyltetrapeptide carboxypeptidase
VNKSLFASFSLEKEVSSFLPLRPGDRIRFVSPASTPERERVMRAAAMLRDWGLRVDFGAHAFDQRGYLAGSDGDRLADFNDALRDPDIRAIFATRGGKGSYRIADRLDFAAARRDPKPLVGFSDITVLHLSLYRALGLPGLHGALMATKPDSANARSLRQALMTDAPITIAARDDEPTGVLTTSGTARGRLLGGNLDAIAISAGWALPPLNGAILLLEAVDMFLGHVDRQLTMLRKAGHLDGIVGVALGQFTGFAPIKGTTILDLLGEHLQASGVPVLGGLPLGHGEMPLCTWIGTDAVLDATAGTLTVAR